ncbi:MAG: M56 family metallopeptidase [Bacteroidota bacterium]
MSFTDKLVNSISWSLIHSLWQGLILTVLAGLVMLITKRSSSSFRYSLLFTLFFLFLGGVAFTFFLEWGAGTGESSGLKLVLNSPDENAIFQPSVFHQLLNKFSFFLHSNSRQVLLVWAIVLGLKSVRMVLDMICVNRLRQQQVFATSDDWKIKLQALCDEMGIRQKVALIESALVKVPIVIGHLKPVILLPIGILTNLRPGEVEAVLLHELAHIRRHDYLVNFIQRITEMLFFFNPGLLWASSLLRIERENCCDDIAIARTKDKRQFVEALISFKEYSLKQPGYAIGLLGKRNLLFQRMSRIVYNRNKTLSPFEAAFFVISFTVFMLLVSAFIKPTQEAQARPLLLYSFKSMPSLSSEPAENIQSALNKNPAQISKEVRPLFASSKSIDNDDIEMKEPVLQEDDLSTNKELTDMNRYNAGKDNEQVFNYRQAAERDRLQSLADFKQAELSRAQAEKDRISADKDREQAELDRKQADKDRAQADLDRQTADKDREQAEKDRIQAEKDRKAADQDRKQIEKMKYPLTRL